MVDFQQEKEQGVDKDKQAAKQQREQTAQLREDACATLSNKVERAAEGQSVEPPANRSGLSQPDSVLPYLQTKNDASVSLEREWSELEKEKLGVQREEHRLAAEKLEIEKAEKKDKSKDDEQKKEDDRKERQLLMQMMARVIEDM